MALYIDWTLSSWNIQAVRFEVFVNAEAFWSTLEYLTSGSSRRVAAPGTGRAKRNNGTLGTHGEISAIHYVSPSSIAKFYLRLSLAADVRDVMQKRREFEE